jgi:MFS family permease
MSALHTPPLAKNAALPLASLRTSKKILIHSVLCLALFLDTFNNSSLFSAIPPIAKQLEIPNSQSVWLLSAYQLTFAALLLIVSPLSGPKMLQSVTRAL